MKSICFRRNTLNTHNTRTHTNCISPAKVQFSSLKAFDMKVLTQGPRPSNLECYQEYMNIKLISIQNVRELSAKIEDVVIAPSK